MQDRLTGQDQIIRQPVAVGPTGLAQKGKQAILLADRHRGTDEQSVPGPGQSNIEQAQFLSHHSGTDFFQHRQLQVTGVSDLPFRIDIIHYDAQRFTHQQWFLTFTRSQAIAGSDEKDDGKLQSLAAMDGHDPHPVLFK